MRHRTTTGTAWLAATLLAGGMLGLAGCAPANSYPRVSEVLATPREAEDVLPDWTADWNVDQESSRFVGTVGHVDYFVSSMTDPDSGQKSACIIQVNNLDTDTAVAGCSSNESGMSTSGMGVGSARISGDTTTYPESEGWVQLTDFLLVNPTGSPLG
ncbi:hypothetical protein E3T61_05125 [Cryobacterium lactosi]|jgi:hypothetical protein|uniref:Lipoprotein n=1 Tax=Cryobacterium lactosi TaxID=1259202 RepID=A0A4R9BYB2_9MICO|nr:hypothetical protein [Cryobacterium lactosi]TFD93471.1 hypothetical protein E3T61_05125 [Cryobacterium lactosi]